MKTIRSKLTYANVMSTIAVFLLLGGGAAFAASKLGKNSVGTKQIKNNAVTAAKIKKGTITGAQIKSGSLSGTQVNASTLGTVPTAQTANAANSATTATTASNLAGYTRKGMTRLVAAATGSYKEGLENAPQTAFFTSGPFTVYAQCFAWGTQTDAVFSIKTSLNGAIFDSDGGEASGDPYYLDTNTEAEKRELLDESADTNEAVFEGSGDSEFDAMAPDGTTIKGDLQIGVKDGTLAAGNGIYGEGNACLFAGDLMTLNG